MTKSDGVNEYEFPTDGLVRLFPLPNFVMFPHVVKGLHIFEPRYCDMLHDALASDHLITMACLLDGWQKNYQDRPAIHNVVCIGKVIRHSPTHDGRHNILLSGLHRARIVREIDSPTRFRHAEVEPMLDVTSHLETSHTQKLFSILLAAFRCAMPQLVIDPAFSEPTVQSMSLGKLTDIIAHLLPLNCSTKRSLLSEVDVEQRTKTLLSLMCQSDMVSETIKKLSEDPSSKPNDFPPKFSQN